MPDWFWHCRCLLRHKHLLVADGNQSFIGTARSSKTLSEPSMLSNVIHTRCCRIITAVYTHNQREHSFTALTRLKFSDCHKIPKNSSSLSEDCGSRPCTALLLELRFYISPDTKYVTLETFFAANLLVSTEKLNLTKQKQTCIWKTIYDKIKHQKTKARSGRLS